MKTVPPTRWIVPNLGKNTSKVITESNHAASMPVSMKSYILFAVLCLAWRCHAATNITIAYASSPQSSQVATFHVPDGYFAKVLYAQLEGSSLSRLSVQSTNLNYNFSVSGAALATNQHLPQFIGPADISLSGNGATFDHGMVTLQIESQTPVFAPSSAVVIPADASGPVNIILESSTDLITWTAALPGTYGTSTQKRFFRVRAER